MAWRTVVGLARLAAASAGIVALIARFVYGLGFHSFATTNYFGYLTMQSNFALVLVNLAAGVVALQCQRADRGGELRRKGHVPETDTTPQT